MTTERQMPPVMILCGGKGTRLREVTEVLPKPMVPIGEQPIIWHIMKSYAAFGVRRFILCLGYKREEFIDYFLNYHARAADITIQLGGEHGITYHDHSGEDDWEVTLANTGLETMTGGRIRKASRYLKPADQYFFMTYGDAVANIDVNALEKTHLNAGKLLTISAVCQIGRFGELTIDNGLVKGFAEKKLCHEQRINGGFMVMDRKFIERYISTTEDSFLESTPTDAAVADGELAAYHHDGFWQCMDTPREYQLLNELWEKGDAPWTKYWRHNVC